MASIGWKRFKFFDEERHREAPLPEGVTASCAGTDNDVWLACADGLVVCMDRDLAIKITFPAFRARVHFLDVTRGKLLAIGEDAEGLKSLTFKCWDLSGLRSSGTTPLLLSSTKIFSANKIIDGSLQSAAACIIEWPSVAIALGTSTGAVHIYKGDAVKGKLTAPFGKYTLRGSSTSGGGGGDGGGTTALHFAGTGASCHVFALSTLSLAALSIATGQPLLEQEGGAPPGCSAVTPSGELLVAGPEAVYFYSAEEGRKAAVAIKGKKHAVAAFKHYLVVVLPDDSSSSTTAVGVGGEEYSSATVLQNGGGASSSSNNSRENMVLRVFDVSNKVVAATAVVDAPVQWIVAASSSSSSSSSSSNIKNSVLAVDASGAAVRFWERSLNQRLDSLFRSRSFQLALRIAQTEGASAKTVAEVHRHFGDFLYGKRDYDGASVQYAATVGVLEPSYVIQKFLDAQRVHNLTTYLEAVHEAGIATADHTTLLLNCYTKLRDVSKIDEFVRGSTSFKFDPTAAIAVLHSSGYAEQAVYVALAAGDTDAYLSILLEDCKRYQEALNYIRSLGRRRAATALHRFGKLLLDGDAVSTTALLMELCLPAAGDHPKTGNGGSIRKNGEDSSSSAAAVVNDDDDDAVFVANLADYTHLYTDRPDDLQYACVTILAMGQSDLPSKQTLYHTLLDLYLSDTTIHGNSSSTSGGGSNITATTSVNNNNNNNKNGHAEAAELLRRGWPPGQEPAYDVDRALTMCRLHSFHQGLVFLYTNRREYREAAVVLADARDWAALLQLCDMHGSSATGGDPEVWHDALERVSSPAAGPSADAALRELLARIEVGNVLPPLVVLPILARNPHLRLELVRDYVIRSLQTENRAIAADVEEAERLKSEVEKAEKEVQRLTTEPVIFQSSRDSQTGAPLELPSVHFLCGHSFNLRTLGDGAEGQECPLCAQEHRRVRELQRSYKASAADKDSFFRQLKAAPDGFSLVAEYFGKGMLNNTSVTTRNPPQQQQ